MRQFYINSDDVSFMQNYVVTGGYDKTVKLWDARTGALLRTFSGHKSSVSRVIFNPLGNLVISG